MTRTSDCIIIGGGVIGLAIARRLAVERFSVTVLERGSCGKEASWAGAGILTLCNPHPADPIAQLHQRSLEMYS
ncbi:MAG: FAD-dependent oxidoreductase, partial [Planctomycetota bacterium]